MKDFGDRMARMLPLFLRAVTKRQRYVFANGNMPVSFIVIMDILSEAGSLTMGEISSAMGVTMSAATALIDKMISQDLVSRQRSEEDRRVVVVTLTKNGSKMAEQVKKDRKEMTEDIYSCLSEAEKNGLINLMEKVFQSLKERV